jgi:hypothetical protein
MMMQKGQCLCGGVKFEADVNEHGFHVCHCDMCRAWASSPLFAVAVDSITFDDEDSVSTYRSSEWAERGFCKQYGSSLFYRLKQTNHPMVCCGLFADHPRLTGDEFVASLQQSD